MSASGSTRVLKVDRDHPDPRMIAEAAEILRGGGLVAFATETVYGLGADATSSDAVARIFTAKGRPASNPLIVHVDGRSMAIRCVRQWPEVADRLASACWPGPLTMVLERSDLIPPIVSAGLDTVALRMPDSAVARALIERLRRPLAAPSANRSTGLSPTRAEHVFKDLAARIELILDSGPTRLGLESTVVDLTGIEPYRILRPGPLSSESLLAQCGIATTAETVATPEHPARSPGQMPVHYAPRTPTIWLEPEQLAMFRWPGRSACLVLGRPEIDQRLLGATEARAFETSEAASPALYATLHAWDEQRFDAIVVIAPPDRPEWQAIRDRLQRASKRLEPSPGDQSNSLG